MSNNNSCRLSAFYSPWKCQPDCLGVSAHRHAHTHTQKERPVSDKVLCFQLEEEVWLDEEQQALVEELKMELLEERRKTERSFDRGDEVRVKAKRDASKQEPENVQFRGTLLSVKGANPPFEKKSRGKKVGPGTMRVQAFLSLQG